MAIQGLTDTYQQQRQLPKLRLGIINDGDKKYPKNPDHFCFDKDEVPEVVAVYGEEPKFIHAILVGSNLAEIMPANYQWFTGGGKSWFMACSGDGDTAAFYDKTKPKHPGLDITKPGFHDGKIQKNAFLRKCLGQQCSDYGPKGCKETARIRVMLPLVSTSTVYEIVTHSVNTIKDFAAAVQNAQKDLSFGNGMGIVFKLFKNEINKQKVNKDATGKEPQKFLYLTCQKDEMFWDTNKDKFMERMRKSAGIEVRQTLMNELGINPMQLSNELRDQVKNADQVYLQAPPENVNKETGEIIEPKDVGPKQPPPQKQQTEAKKVNATVVDPLENDKEVIAKVALVYPGKEVPKDAVKNAIAKYGNKEALIYGIDTYLASKKKTPPAQQQSSPPPQNTPNPSTTNDSLL